MWEPLITTGNRAQSERWQAVGFLSAAFQGPSGPALWLSSSCHIVTLSSVHIPEHSGTYMWPIIQNAHPRVDHGFSFRNTSLRQCSHGYSLPNQPPSHGEGWSLLPSSFTWRPQSQMTPLWGSASIFPLYQGSQRMLQGWNTTPVFHIWPHYPCLHRHPLYHNKLIHSLMSLVAQTVKNLPAMQETPFDP